MPSLQILEDPQKVSGFLLFSTNSYILSLEMSNEPEYSTFNCTPQL